MKPLNELSQGSSHITVFDQHTLTSSFLSDIMGGLSALLFLFFVMVGQWVLPFNASFTQEERFYVDKYRIAQVPMMFRSDKYHLAYDPDLKVGILKLPSSGGAAMLIVFPDEDVDITSIDDELYANTYLDWVKKLKRT